MGMGRGVIRVIGWVKVKGEGGLSVVGFMNGE